MIGMIGFGGGAYQIPAARLQLARREGVISIGARNRIALHCKKPFIVISFLFKTLQSKRKRKRERKRKIEEKKKVRKAEET